MSRYSEGFRLTRIRIKNFRSIADADVELNPITVFIGPNGSGKSNVVDALRFVRDISTRGLDQAVLDREGMSVIRRWAPQGRPYDVVIGLWAEVDNIELHYEFILGSSKSEDFNIKKEYLEIKENNKIITRLDKQGDEITGTTNNKSISIVVPKEKFNAPNLSMPSGILREIRMNAFRNKNPDVSSLRHKQESVANQMQHMIVASQFYHLNPNDLRQPQRMVRETPFDERGQNLAAVLKRIRRSRGDDLEEMKLTLGRLVDGVEDFSVTSAGGFLVTKIHYSRPDGKIRKSDLLQESDGTIRMLGLLAALYQRPPQPLLAVEEPEANIHPGALGVLAGVLDQASLHSQIIITTHSPDILDQLPVDSFRVVEKVNGESKIGPVKHEQIETVRERLFSAGELMRMEGLRRESNEITGGNLSQEE